MAEAIYGEDGRLRDPSTGTGSPGDDDPSLIRADIGETRRRMSYALDEIGDRMNPQHLKEQIRHGVRDATIGRAENMARHTADRAREARYTIMDTIRDNPLPAAITGLGLGWLVWNGRKHDDDHQVPMYGYRTWENDPYGAGRSMGYGQASTDWTDERGRTGEGIREKAEELTEGARHVVDEAREAAGDAAHRAQEFAERTAEGARSTAHRIAEQTRYRSHRLEDRFDDTMRNNPLAVGAAAAALGLVIGLAAPPTRQEVELMGDARDRLRDRARDATRDATEKITHVAEAAAESATSTARETARQEGLTH